MQASITKLPRMEWLKRQFDFPSSRSLGRPGQVPRRSSVCKELASRCPHQAKRGIVSLTSLLTRALIPFVRSPPSWPNDLPAAPLPKSISGVRLQCTNLGVTNIQPKALAPVTQAAGEGAGSSAPSPDACCYTPQSPGS